MVRVNRGFYLYGSGPSGADVRDLQENDVEIEGVWIRRIVTITE